MSDRVGEGRPSSGLFSFSLVSDAKMAIGGATTPLGPWIL